MVNYRTFEISDELFSGFRLKIDLDDIDCLEDIIAYCYQVLSNILNDNNLQSLLAKLNRKSFHIHGYIMTDLLLSDGNRIFYICGHC